MMTPTKKIVKMEDLISKKTENDDKNDNKNLTKKIKSVNQVVRGKPKSGRIWKSEKKKFSSIIKTRGVKNSFQKKEELRRKLQQVKEASNAIKAAKAEEKELKKQRRRDNLKRQEENQRKSEVVQVITNTKKLKKMKKKQLRYIEKRDTTKVG